MNDTDKTFDVLRDLPVEVTLEQVGNMVAGFPLAVATGSWLSNFNFNSILMTTAGTILVASSMYVLTATRPAAAPLAVPAAMEIAPEEAVVWTLPNEQPIVRPEPIVQKSAVQLAITLEAPTVAPPEPIAEVLPAPEPVAPKATVWVRDETKEFDVKGFTGLKLLGSMDVVIEQGPFHVQSDGNPDLAELFNVSVIGNTLNITTREPEGDERLRSCKNGAVLTVRMPALERIELFGSGTVHASDFANVGALELDLKGSGDIHVEDFAGIDALRVVLTGSGDVVSEGIAVGGKTDVALSGSGDVRLEGRTSQLEVQLIGSGDVDASDLLSDACRVNIRGSGDVLVHCTKTIDNTVIGSGEVHETGNADRVRGEGSRTY